jgi:hypothetical protein
MVKGGWDGMGWFNPNMIFSGTHWYPIYVDDVVPFMPLE